MQAIGLRYYGETSTLENFTINHSDPIDVRDVFIHVYSCAVSHIDCQRRTNYGNISQNCDRMPEILGYEGSGIVKKIGTNVKYINVGDCVWFVQTTNRTGSNSEFCVVDERLVSKKPANMSFGDAASLPLSSCQVWPCLFESLGLYSEQNAHEGASILIIGGSTPEGLLATMICTRYLGMIVIGAVWNEDDKPICTRNGAVHAVIINETLVEQLLLLNYDGVEFILCTVDPLCVLDQVWGLLTPFGHFASTIPPSEPSTISSHKLASKCISITFDNVFLRMLNNKKRNYIRITLDMMRQLVENGRVSSLRCLSPFFSSLSYSAAGLVAAHEAVQAEYDYACFNQAKYISSRNDEKKKNDNDNDDAAGGLLNQMVEGKIVIRTNTGDRVDRESVQAAMNLAAGASRPSLLRLETMSATAGIVRSLSRLASPLKERLEASPEKRGSK